MRKIIHKRYDTVTIDEYNTRKKCNICQNLRKAVHEGRVCTPTLRAKCMSKKYKSRARLKPKGRSRRNAAVNIPQYLLYTQKIPEGQYIAVFNFQCSRWKLVHQRKNKKAPLDQTEMVLAGINVYASLCFKKSKCLTLERPLEGQIDPFHKLRSNM